MSTQEMDSASMQVPFFDDETVVALAVARTHLPEPRVRAIVEGQFWYEACLDLAGVEGPKVEEKKEEARRRFPRLFDEEGSPLPIYTFEDEAEYIAETTGIFADEVTRVLCHVRAYEVQIGIVDESSIEDYRAWRRRWLTTRARPPIVWVDGKPVAYSFHEALRREAE